ncbi:TonB-dependent receptor [Muricauda sp. DJ-13]|uniref:TonB-dependent receptor n=2 Tax=Croceivirga thetidis TaxID=2721623 RepID=A0ABX1GTM2_9FLAO|nr:TonB-dependent receptor [Croceivirga thetidis]
MVFATQAVKAENYSESSILESVQATITGTVTDADGIPLGGANVLVKGTTNGTQTDFDGNFTIEADSNATLVFSYVGFASQEIAVGGRSTINVTMQEDANQLSEVVVLGYAAQTRGDVTGSVASVDMEEAVKTPVVNAAEVLQGRVTGVQVVTNGNPGQAPKINIRGFGTSNNTNPLYIIDGVQTDDPNVLNNINPTDIEQMNVLKDGAAAIYGARASNGVIIITTKSGGYNQDKANVTVDLYTGFSKISNPIDLLNVEQHADMIWQSQINDGLTPSHPQYGSGATPVIPSQIVDYTRVQSYDPIVFFAPGQVTATVQPGGTDWVDEISQTGVVTNASVSLSDGGESGKYFASVSYLNREGVLNQTGFKRGSTKMNSEFKITDKITIGEHMNFSFSNTRPGNDEAIEMAYRISPLVPVRDDDGFFAGSAPPGIGNPRNPVAQLFRTRNNYFKRFAGFGDIYLNVEFLPGFTFRSTLAGGFGTFDTRQFTELDPENGEPISTNTLVEQNQTSYNWNWSNIINMNKSFGEHNINAIVGVEALKDGAKGNQVSRQGFLFEDPNFYLLSNGQSAPNVDFAFDGFNSLFSIFGTANYNYKSRYFLTATLRRDESSRFLGDNKSDIFPSFSAGWLVSDEDFWPADGIVNRLKLKGSWGELGNQTLPANNPTVNISSLSESLANYSFDGSGIATGALLTQVGNPDLRWETSETTNFGAELGMLDNRLSISAEYFIIKTKDLITRDFNLISSTAIDAGAPLVNLGDIQNKGIDLAIGYGDTTDGGFSYDISVNVSQYKNEVTRLINDSPVAGRGDLRNGSVTRTEVGDELSFFFGRNVVGLDDNGRFIYEDVDGDGESLVDGDDRTKIGSPHPDFTYGINASLAYKGFDAQLFFTGSQGNDIYNYGKVFTDFGLFFNSNRSTRVLNAWTPTNTNTNVPALTTSYPLEEASANSYFVEDGSYFRLKNLQIGYTLPSDISKKAGLESIRLYVQGTNVFTITDYEGFDPEVVAYDNLSLGIDSRVYPQPRIYTLGLSLKL